MALTLFETAWAFKTSAQNSYLERLATRILQFELSNCILIAQWQKPKGGFNIKPSCLWLKCEEFVVFLLLLTESLHYPFQTAILLLLIDDIVSGTRRWMLPWAEPPSRKRPLPRSQVQGEMNECCAAQIGNSWSRFVIIHVPLPSIV